MATLMSHNCYHHTIIPSYLVRMIDILYFVTCCIVHLIWVGFSYVVDSSELPEAFLCVTRELFNIEMWSNLQQEPSNYNLNFALMCPVSNDLQKPIFF